MRKLATLLVAWGALWLGGAEARAAVITIDPLEQTVTLGDQATIAVNVSGLGSFSSPSLGTFDIDVGFDSALLSEDTVTFGSELDVLGLGSIQGVGPGFVLDVNVFELSLDDPADLDALQAGAFTLFTMTFDTLAVGTSTVELFVNALGDAEGLPLQFETSTALIHIVSSSQPAPEPATLLLLAAGLLSVAVRRKRD